MSWETSFFLCFSCLLELSACNHSTKLIILMLHVVLTSNISHLSLAPKGFDSARFWPVSSRRRLGFLRKLNPERT